MNLKREFNKYYNDFFNKHYRTEIWVTDSILMFTSYPFMLYRSFIDTMRLHRISNHLYMYVCSSFVRNFSHKAKCLAQFIINLK